MLDVEQDAGSDLDAGNGSHRQRRFFGALCLAFGALAVTVGTTSAETWRGLTVSPEHRCSPQGGRSLATGETSLICLHKISRFL